MILQFKREKRKTGDFHQKVYLNDKYIADIYEADGDTKEIAVAIETIVKAIDSNIEVIKVDDVSNKFNFYVEE